MPVYINTLPFEKGGEIIEIAGETFIPGEWLHLPDDFQLDAVKYPYIKEAGAVLQEKIKAALEAHEIPAFAQGVREARERHGEKVDQAVIDVHAYAPYDTEAAVDGD